MDIETYRARREQALKALEPKRRLRCLKCNHPDYGCYCAKVQSFDPKIKFAILIHPIEASRRIATGRMSHLILENSELIRGHNFTDNRHVNGLINDPANQCFILYPGYRSRNMSEMPKPVQIFDPSKQPVLFVIDGTWGTAKKMVNQSPNLFSLPRVAFTPTQASRFRVRKQPRPNFCSTIEAIHHAIEILGEGVGFNTMARTHDHLLNVFDGMVEAQLALMRTKPHWRIKNRT